MKLKQWIYCNNGMVLLHLSKVTHFEVKPMKFEVRNDSSTGGETSFARELALFAYVTIGDVSKDFFLGSIAVDSFEESKKSEVRQKLFRYIEEE